MKNITLILTIISALGSSNSAYASEIYKCTDENAQISFSFSSCPSFGFAIPEEHLSTSIEEQINQLEVIDREISRLKRQFRDLKLEQEYSLQSAKDIHTERSMRVNYEKSTQVLLDRLVVENHKRGQLIDRTVALLSQPHS